MLNVLITGARGFVGKNLSLALRQQKELGLYGYDLENSPEELRKALAAADVIFHLAGVNRPKEDNEFETGNAGFTSELCDLLGSQHRTPKIVLSSSIQAEKNNPYGKSKREAEEILRKFAEDSGAECVVYRLKNLFGKWCRPNYNSVTATFCHNIAHDLPIEISDPSHQMDLTYIDDVVNAFLGELVTAAPGFRYAEPLPSYRVTLGELADTVNSFRQMRSSLHLPDYSSPFVRRLYATYLSYLEPRELEYQLTAKSDPRGSLAEFIKSPSAGQIFVSRTHPGITRGNHYHHTKVEKFLVLQGEAVIRLRHVLGKDVVEIHVQGEEYRVVDIPPGYTHSIRNIGSTDLITLFWADEVFDPDHPDTFYEEV